MNETMSLIGGIDMYSYPPKRHKSDVAPKGRKVVFLDKNGYDSELEKAREFFERGDELTIKEIYIGRTSSTVNFEEYLDKNFNTVMFADKEVVD